MKISFTILLLLASCAERPEAFTPVPVDMPVPVACHVPEIPPPSDALAGLTQQTPLADGMKACLAAQILQKAYAAQLLAALNACRQ